jgi:coenzyme F420-0:L-glutamate ligase
LEIIGLKSSIIKPKEDILKVLIKSIKNAKISLKEKDIIVIASKVLAVSQGRLFNCKNKDYKSGMLKKIIKKEAGELFETNYCWLTFKNGHLIPNAGVDRSNVPRGTVVLWPKDPYKEAEKIQKNLKKAFGLKNLGILIADSTCSPMRVGVHGVSIGHYGFKGIEDCRGRRDIYGEKIYVTRRAIADSLASAALIIMGETNERTPFALISNAPIKFINKRERRAFIRLKSDLFYGIYNNAFKKFLSRKK